MIHLLVDLIIKGLYYIVIDEVNNEKTSLRIPARKHRPHDQRPIGRCPADSRKATPKIELSVFVPGPWVVFGASPERRFSHAASTALERLPPVKIIRLPW